MTRFDSNLEKKLLNVLNTQDSIQSLSMWILHHRSHYSRITNLWLRILKKSKISHRLTLIYLANDVIQNSKRKSGQTQPYLESFRDVMKEAALLSRDEKIRPAVERVFNIWEERNIYEADFIAELKDILVNSKVSSVASSSSKIISEFECAKLTKQIALTDKLCKERAVKETAFSKKSDLPWDQLLRKMKDKSHGYQYTQELDETAHMLEGIIAAFVSEQEERNKEQELLEQAHLYYGSMRRDSKAIANAYKNFANRVQVVSTKLQPKLARSPVPSPPTTDAPSPTNSDEGPLLPLAEVPPGASLVEEEEELEGGALLLSKVEGVGDQPPSPGAVPSPEGSPIGFSPKKGNSPIPGGVQGHMTSWLGSFAPRLGNSTKGSSLESRLSTMRQAFGTETFLGSPQRPPTPPPHQPVLSHITNIISLTASPLRETPAGATVKQSCLVTLTTSEDSPMPMEHFDSPSRSTSPPDPFGLKEWQAVPNLTTVHIDGDTDLFSGKDMDYRNLNGSQNGEHYAPLTPPIIPSAFTSAPNPWTDVPPPSLALPPTTVPPPPQAWNTPPPPVTSPVRDWWPRAPSRWMPYPRPQQPPPPY